MIKDITFCVSDLCDKRHACVRSIYHQSNEDLEGQVVSMSNFYKPGLFDCGNWLPDSLDYMEYNESTN